MSRGGSARGPWREELDHVVGVEMLYLSKRAPEADLQRLLFEYAPH